MLHDLSLTWRALVFLIAWLVDGFGLPECLLVGIGLPERKRFDLVLIVSDRVVCLCSTSPALMFLVLVSWSCSIVVVSWVYPGCILMVIDHKLRKTKWFWTDLTLISAGVYIPVEIALIVADLMQPMRWSISSSKCYLRNEISWWKTLWPMRWSIIPSKCYLRDEISRWQPFDRCADQLSDQNAICADQLSRETILTDAWINYPTEISSALINYLWQF